MQKGYSQKDLATAANLHRVQYNRYENGETTPSTDTLSKLADALGVSVDYLLEGKEEDAATANLEDRELLKMFEELEKLSKEDKAIAKEMIDSFLFKRRIRQQVAS
jgi:transcriptional regulator with XRE-family HTH domain